MNLKPLQSLYSSFEISEPVGNNAFSYEQRQHKTIWVPPLVSGTLSDLALGEEIVFSEIEDGIEQNRTGLKNFLYFSFGGKDIFIFDNHNHAFFFWLAGYLQGAIKPETPLVHIDQHTDMRKPAVWPAFTLGSRPGLKEIFLYTNHTLHVGNFIQPALRLGLFSEVEIIDSSTALGRPVPDAFVLDMDLDIFSEDMRYIPNSAKRKAIQKYLEAARFITIATSPFFMDQQEALRQLMLIFDL